MNDSTINPLTIKIIDFLNANSIEFEERDHPPATTCLDSAKLRGESMDIGGKALFMKSNGEFSLFVLSASKQVNSNKVRKILKSQKVRFATHDELYDLVGVEKGALPPFGRPILPYDLYLDESILENSKIAFNVAMLTKSLILDLNDYLSLVHPTICQFSK